ncbi:hypothetical protein ACA097_24930 [Pseudomonas sp. QL9]
MLSNKSRREIGVVNDDGSAYLSGVESGDRSASSWSLQSECR